MNRFPRGKRFDSRDHALIAADLFPDNLDAPDALFARQRGALARARITDDRVNPVGASLIADQFAQAVFVEIGVVSERGHVGAENAAQVNRHIAPPSQPEK